MISKEKFQKTSNLLINYVTIVLGGMFSLLGNMTTAMGEAFSTVVVPKESREEVKKKIREQVNPMFTEMVKNILKMRRSIYPLIKKKEKKIRKMLNEEVCDRGIAIVEKYSFERPAFTEKLGNKDVAYYVQLMHKQDPKFGEMLQELSGWMNSDQNAKIIEAILPVPPAQETTSKKTKTAQKKHQPL